MLLDSNTIIYSAKREYAELRRFMAKNVYSVSAVSRIEVLGYHLLATEQYQYLIDFFQAADILRISDAVVTEAVKLRQTKRMGLGDAIVAGTALASAYVGHQKYWGLQLDPKPRSHQSFRVAGVSRTRV